MPATPLEKLQFILKDNDISVACLFSPENVGYFSGFFSEPHERVLGIFVFQDSDPFLFTPALDVDDASKTDWPYDIYSYEDHENPFTIIAEQIMKKQPLVQKIAIEENHLNVTRFKTLTQLFPEALFSGITSDINNIRLIKSKDEIEKMRHAGKTADLAVEIGVQTLREGISELEVVAEIEYQMKKRGVSDMSFETMVLFGDHAANPHGIPGNRQLKKGEFILFDLGTVHENYVSDTTRTVAFGEITNHQSEIYNLVLKANETAIAAITPGMTAEELDGIARKAIADAGYGEYFNHRLGHGIGQSIHEYPSIVQGNGLVIQEGMCFSIEPGIYIPGDVGVRIEDCIYVTKDGAIPFTQMTKKLQIIT